MLRAITVICVTCLLVTAVHASTKATWNAMISAAPSEEEIENQKTNVTVRGVSQGSPAAKSGIRPGDTIVVINDEPVNSIKDATALLSSSTNNCNLLLKRGGIPLKRNIILNPQPSRLGAYFYDGPTSVPVEPSKEMTGCKNIIGNIVIIADVKETKEYYRVGVYIKNFGKAQIVAPYNVLLQDNSSLMLKLMTPQELLYAWHGGVYTLTPQAITSLPTSYNVSSTSTVSGGSVNTESTITAANNYNGFNMLAGALAAKRVVKAVANRQADEVWLNNNYLRKTEIPAGALYQGALFFAKSSNNAQGVKLTVYVDEKHSVTCDFESKTKASKK